MFVLDRNIITEHLNELMLNDPIISAFCIASADRIIGRSCISSEEREDNKWWQAHNSAMMELLDATARNFR